MTVPDDHYVLFLPDGCPNSGTIRIWAENHLKSWVDVYYRLSSGSIDVIVNGSTWVLTNNTALTGTTGTDGYFNLSCTPSGFYIENRVGAEKTFHYSLIA